jgi:hypothetical protein
VINIAIKSWKYLKSTYEKNLLLGKGFEYLPRGRFFNPQFIFKIISKVFFIAPPLIIGYQNVLL